MPQDKAALPYLLAKKCRFSYEQFLETKEAVYAFNFMQGEKVRQVLGSLQLIYMYFLCFWNAINWVNITQDSEMCATLHSTLVELATRKINVA